MNRFFKSNYLKITISLNSNSSLGNAIPFEKINSCSLLILSVYLQVNYNGNYFQVFYRHMRLKPCFSIDWYMFLIEFSRNFALHNNIMMYCFSLLKKII